MFWDTTTNLRQHSLPRSSFARANDLRHSILSERASAALHNNERGPHTEKSLDELLMYTHQRTGPV